MNIKYHVELSQDERDRLETLLSGGRHSARRLKRAQILLAADDSVADDVIASTLKVSASTIYRTRRRLVTADLDAALSEEPRARRCAEVIGQGGGVTGGDCLLEAAARSRSLDA